jgi:hypothetical protein
VIIESKILRLGRKERQQQQMNIKNMNTPLKWIIGCMATCALAATTLAQGTYNSSSTPPNPSGSSIQSAGQSSQFYHSRMLLGREAKDSTGQNVGSIHDIVFNPQNGEVFAAIGVNSGKYTLVPWQALTVNPTNARGKEQVTVNTTKQELESAPAVSGTEWQQLNNSAFTLSIYSHYNLQPPSAMGGTGTGAMGGSSTGSSPGTTPR